MTINLPGKLFGIIFISISLLLLAACNSAKSGSSTTTNTPVTTVSVLTISTTTTEAADDIVFVPACRRSLSVWTRHCHSTSRYEFFVSAPNRWDGHALTGIAKGST